MRNRIAIILSILAVAFSLATNPSMQTVISNNAADMANHIVMVADSTTARTVTNLFTFNRGGTLAPFAVGNAGAAVVSNLNADKLDGLDGPTSTIVGINDTQTLTAKTITNPTVTTGTFTSPTINTTLPGNVLYGLCGGRLSLTSGTPVTSADVTGAASVYWEPYSTTGTGTGVCGLYDGSATWTLLPFTETTLAIGTLTNDLPYDVFIYNNSGTLAIESLAWSSKTARATNLTTQNGVPVKTGATTRRYVGTFHTTATTTTEDSLLKRLLWNYYNRVPRTLQRLESTATWNYSINTIRQANASTSNQVAAVIGVAESQINLNISAVATASAGSNDVNVCVGEDTTTACTGILIHTSLTTGSFRFPITALLVKYPAIGYHFYSWNEVSANVTTTTWEGATGSGASATQSGMSGFIF